MQLILSLDELQLLADLLENRDDELSNSILDRLIAHDFTFDCIELDFLCNLLNQLKCACRDGKQPQYRSRLEVIQSTMDKLATAAAMV
jgi:hypothetical protein